MKILITSCVLFIFIFWSHAEEYCFTNGTRAVYWLRSSSMESSVSCHLAVECVGVSPDNKMELLLHFSNFVYSSTLPYPVDGVYSQTCARIKKFVTKIKMDPGGKIFASNLSEILGRLKLSDVQVENAMKDILLEFWILFCECVIPEIGNIDMKKDNKTFLLPRKWNFLSDEFWEKEIGEGYVTMGWMNIIPKISIPGGSNHGCLLWCDIIEKEFTNEFWEDEETERTRDTDIIVSSKARLYFDRDKGIFSRVEIRRITDSKSPIDGKPIQEGIFFDAQLIDYAPGAREERIPREFLDKCPKSFLEMFSREELEKNPDFMRVIERWKKEKMGEKINIDIE